MATAKAGIGDAFNPYKIMHDAQAFVGQNKLILIILAIIIAFIAAYMLYSMYTDYTNMTAKERGFRRGKTNIMAVLRVEILNKIKKKRKV